MRISRPCYDKMHRCPGWVGGGMRYAKIQTCPGGRLPMDLYDGRWWKWRFNRCTTCGLLVWPYVIRYLDPTWYPSEFRFMWWRVQDWWRYR